MKTLLILAGLGQVLLAAGSLALPRILAWRRETARLGALTRRIFWTYAGYILGTNLALALASILLAEELLAGGPLERAFGAYAALYWGARLAIQLAAFRPVAPRGGWYGVADGLVTALFAGLAAVYAALAVGAGA